MRAVEADYLRDSEQLSLAQWRQRPAWKRSLAGIARLVDSFM